MGEEKKLWGEVQYQDLDEHCLCCEVSPVPHHQGVLPDCYPVMAIKTDLTTKTHPKWVLQIFLQTVRGMQTKFVHENTYFPHREVSTGPHRRGDSVVVLFFFKCNSSYSVQDT